MNRVIVKTRIDADGVLRVTIPLTPEDANREVEVTIEPTGPPPMTQEEWRQFIMSTAGTWQGEFERPEQGEFEEREPLP